MIKKTLLVILLHFGFLELNAQVARVQIINNIADMSVSDIDIYVNGSLMVDNLAFRSGSGFTIVTAGSSINIGIALGTSFNVNDTFKNFTTTLTPTTDYFLVVNGLKSTSGYTPLKPVSISLYSGVQPSAIVPTNVDLLFLNGSTDAQTHDIRSGIKTLANDVAYGNYSGGYSNIVGGDVKFRMTNTAGTSIIKSYDAQFSTLGFVGKAGLVIASGFATPSANSNGPSLGLWLATSSPGPLTELPQGDAEPIARGQFIHNCADTTADTVDIYIDGVKTFDDLRFRNATTFIDFLAKTNVDIHVAPRTSTSTASAFYTLAVNLDSAGTYLFVANGIQSATGYNPAPSFRLSKYNSAREAAVLSTNTDVVFVNGSTDAASMTISDVPAATTWFSGITFGNFSTNYYTSATANNTLKLANGSVNSYYLGNFSTQGWAGQAVTILASGFTDSTTNSKGPKLGLWAATAAGGALIKLPPTTVGISKTINEANNIKTYPVPAHDILFLSIENKAITAAYIFDVYGKLIKQCNNISNNKIDIRELASGAYFMKLNIEGTEASQTIRFIKQ